LTLSSQRIVEAEAAGPQPTSPATCLHPAADDGIVVVEVGGKEDAVDVHAVPRALRSALGPDATQALLEVLERSHQHARPAVIAACTGRFERRLVEEISSLRLEMAQQGSGLRLEMAQQGAGLRVEMAQQGADLRQEMNQLAAGLRAEMAAGRVELIRWSFLFWVGQVIAIGGVMGVLLRTLR
jgi:hypothetical protein